MYTANAVATSSPSELSKKRSVCESVDRADCVPTKTTAVQKSMSLLTVYGEIRNFVEMTKNGI
jgi:hypothetical protein